MYIHSHDTGRLVQPYGHAVPTPNIQKLAEEGVLFRQAYCAAPTCSPSRASLLTGEYPHNNGMPGLVHRGFSLYNPEHHIVYTLRRAGYFSVLAGVHHITRHTNPIGFDEILELSTQNAKEVAPSVVQILRRPLPQPFFLAVGFSETHRKFPPPGPEDDPRYVLSPSTLPDTPEIREDVAAFKTSVRALDHGVGQVLRALEEYGLAENTLVVNTTDHGPAFPGMKCTLTDNGIGVSLIIRGPGGFSGGRVCDALVSHLDLFPTICDLTGISAPSWLQGKSLMPLIRGQAAEIREEIFGEINYHAAIEPQRAVRSKRHKYIRRFHSRAQPVYPNTDDSPGKSLWLDSSWQDRTTPAERLYDLVFDPNEQNNLADDPAYAHILGEMRARLEHWIKETNDPLLRGELPLPPGVTLNDPDQLSPSDPAHTVS